MSILNRRAPRAPLLRLVFERDWPTPDDPEPDFHPVRVGRVDGLLEIRSHRWSPPCSWAEWAGSDGGEGLEDFVSASDLPGVDLAGVELLVVTGRMWSHRYSTCDGEDHDAGFDLERVEFHELRDRATEDSVRLVSEIRPLEETP